MEDILKVGSFRAEIFARKVCGQGLANVWNALREVGPFIFHISGIKEDLCIQPEL